ncbi:MAG TPA: VOC family protein [Terriglobia bacterium]|nr:VOC family protein [Terriglobia bacterium]
MRLSKGILETSLYCSDLDAAERFYTAVLGLERIGRQCGRHVFFRCGQGVLLLFNPGKTGKEPSYVNGIMVPMHGTGGEGHLAFRISASEIPIWREHLQRQGVTLEAEINWPEGGQSIYFRDPAGNSLELATPAVWGFEEV